MSALQIAERYFDLSNAADLDAIEVMIADDATYSSDNTGLYYGLDDIMAMKRNFYGQFEKLTWNVTHKSEPKPGIVEFVFSLEAIANDKSIVRRDGIERMIIVNDKLRHIEVRNK